jgi:hypothetical protein
LPPPRAMTGVFSPVLDFNEVVRCEHSSGGFVVMPLHK